MIAYTSNLGYIVFRLTFGHGTNESAKTQKLQWIAKFASESNDSEA